MTIWVRKWGCQPGSRGACRVAFSNLFLTRRRGEHTARLLIGESNSRATSLTCQPNSVLGLKRRLCAFSPSPSVCVWLAGWLTSELPVLWRRDPHFNIFED